MRSRISRIELTIFGSLVSALSNVFASAISFFKAIIRLLSIALELRSITGAWTASAACIVNLALIFFGPASMI